MIDPRATSTWCWARRGFSIRSVKRFVGLCVVGLAAVSLAACSETTEPKNDEPIVNPITTWAGVGGRAGFNGDGLPLSESWMSYPCDLEFTSTGCYVLDWNSHRVRRVTAQNTFETVVGTNFLGDGDPALNDRFFPGVPGTTIYLNHPTDVDELPDGRILVSSWHNHKLRILDPTTGLVYVSCGAGAGFFGDGGPAENALLNQPSEAIVAPDGTITILDQRNQRIRRIAPDGTINTIVGSGCWGPNCEGAYEGDGGPPLSARLNFPTGSNPSVGGGIALDSRSRLYIADTNNHRVRRVDFGLNVIETVAGNGTGGFAGDGGSAVDAMLNYPRDIEIGPDGNLYIVDLGNHRIRMVDLTTGIISTLVGDGVPRYAGDGGSATKASLYYPEGIAFDSAGDLYIADVYNHVICEVDL
jgi:NHL repeat